MSLRALLEVALLEAALVVLALIARVHALDGALRFQTSTIHSTAFGNVRSLVVASAEQLATTTGGDSIYITKFNATTGALTFTMTVKPSRITFVDATGLAITPDNAFLCVSGNKEESLIGLFPKYYFGIRCLSRSSFTTSGSYTSGTAQRVSLSAIAIKALGAGGTNYIYAISQTTNQLQSFKLTSSGSVEIEGSSKSVTAPSSIAVATRTCRGTTNNIVFVAANSQNKISVYRHVDTNGPLLQQTFNLMGLRELAVSANNQYLLATNASSSTTNTSTLTVFSASCDGLQLTPVDSWTDPTSIMTKIVVSGDGLYTYVATESGTVHSFAFDATNGRLTHLSVASPSGSSGSISALAITQTDKQVFAAHTSSNSVAAYEREGFQCTLTSANCSNGATFLQDQCSCSCTNFWAGEFCTECAGYCLNNGTLESNCTCSCLPQWTGANCEVCNLDFSCSNGTVLSQTTCMCEEINQESSSWLGSSSREPSNSTDLLSSSSSLSPSSSLPSSASYSSSYDLLPSTSDTEGTSEYSSSPQSSSTATTSGISGRTDDKGSSYSNTNINNSISSSDEVIEAASKSQLTMIIAGSVAGAVVVLLVILFCFLLIVVLAVYKNKSGHMPQMDLVSESTEMVGISFESQMPRRPEIQVDVNKFIIPIDQIKIDKKIGQGAMGTVFLGYWGEDTVAVKRFNVSTIEHDEAAMEKFMNDFAREVSILCQFRHQNILCFMGAATTPPNLAIITEYCDNGTLYDLIYKKLNGGSFTCADGRLVRFDWTRKLTVILEIALGMGFLHARGLIHRDLKSHNILLDKRLTAKVADFGLAKIKNDYDGAKNAGAKVEEMTQMVGTPLWMAPEVITATYGRECDVYSFSMIMYECLVEQLPFHEQTVKSDIHFRVCNDENFRPVVPPPESLDADIYDGDVATIIEQKRLYIDLMRRCWQHDPTARPSFTEIIAVIRGLLN